MILRCKRTSAASLFLSLQILGCATAPARLDTRDPSQLYGELFEKVQLAPVFWDSKTFVDLVPRENPSKIRESYASEKPKSKAELRKFVDRHFAPPVDTSSQFKAKKGRPINRHIKRLWPYLRRAPEEPAAVNPASSLIPLPYAYIVPGGRFQEIYYWDSYFTQLGLLADEEEELFQNMVKNFSYLLQSMGRIPNGNRDYYRGRSQPPFFSHMVSLWQDRFGVQSALQFLPALKVEHDFWMNGSRAVNLEGGTLNRYWDDRAGPRPEAYKEDVALGQRARFMFSRELSEVYRDLRAAAESGWDFSTRWFKDPREFATIQTTAYVPIDLNALLYHLELKISELAKVAGEGKDAEAYAKRASDRRDLIQHYLWNEEAGAYSDYDVRAKDQSAEFTIAMVVPLFVGIATEPQAKRMAALLQKKFLKPGGFVTTLRVSGQQWDAPNGWAPHQWMGYSGLKRYGQDSVARTLRARWLALNQRVYARTGKLMEKYNVVDMDLPSGGGEYPLQDGFGWTNGVYRALESAKQRESNR